MIGSAINRHGIYSFIQVNNCYNWYWLLILLLSVYKEVSTNAEKKNIRKEIQFINKKTKLTYFIVEIIKQPEICAWLFRTFKEEIGLFKINT